MQDWYDIYKERMNDRYLNKVKTKYRPFLDKIKSANCYHFVELGCGAGFVTKAIREYSKYSNYTMVDSCPKMLGLAVQNNPTRKCLFLCGDITVHHTIPFCDDHTMVHSHGVLEHLSDEDIMYTLNIADSYGPWQVHYVPGAKYEIPSRGDERLMTVEQWEDILSKYDRPVKFEVTTFNDGYDIMISIWRDTFKEWK